MQKNPTKTPPKPGIRERNRRMEKEVEHFIIVLDKKQKQLDIATGAINLAVEHLKAVDAVNKAEEIRVYLDKIAALEVEMQSQYSQEEKGTPAKTNKP